MATVIAVYNSEGCVGRCDGKCHDAEPGSVCDCICGGINHAAGGQKAVDNTRNMFEEWIEEYKLRVPDIQEVEVPVLYTTRTVAARRIARHINKQYGAVSAVKDVERVSTVIEKTVVRRVFVDNVFTRVPTRVKTKKNLWRVTLDNGTVIEKPTSKAIDVFYANPLHKGAPAIQIPLI